MASETRVPQERNALTEEIVQTYTDVGTVNYLGHAPLPRYEQIVSVLEDLKDIIFPGYRRREGLHLGNVAYHVGDLVDRLHTNLSKQVARALRHEVRVGRSAPGAPQPDQEYEDQGQALALAFLQRIPAVRRILATDVQAAYDGDPACQNLDEVIFCYPGLEAVTVHRLAHELFLLKTPFIPRMMAEWAHRATGIDIHPGATIGNHFFIDHGTGVVIGETCQIGNHVKLYQGVTLGALSFPTDTDGNVIRAMKRHPTLEDRVVVYANATILGGQTCVGHDAVIGSSVWLTEGVAPHTTVLLEKPKLRLRAESPTGLEPEISYQI